MAQATDGRDVLPFVFGGDCDKTVARLVVEPARSRLIAHERPEGLLRPVSGVDYDDLIHDPGDGVVTRSSLLGRYGGRLLPAFDRPAPLRVEHSVFLCEQHQFLTGNPSFQDNLLHALFASDEVAQAAPIPRDGARCRDPGGQSGAQGALPG